MNKSILRSTTWLAVIWLGWLSGCGGGADVACNCQPEACETCTDKLLDQEDQIYQDYLAEADDYHRLVKEFHHATQGEGSAANVLKQVDLFFDMSDGMHAKITEAEGQGSGLLTDLVNVVSGSGNQAGYFRLERNAPEKFVPLEGGNVKSFVRNPRNYKSDYNYAPLDTAVAKIVARHDRQSILITDGELAKRSIVGTVDRGDAWAVTAFKQWLGEGNRLDFVVMPTSKDQRLFFIFFTPQKLASEKNIVDGYLEATRDVNNADGYQHLKFSINDYKLNRKEDGRRTNENGYNSSFVYNVGYFSPKVDLAAGYEHLHIDDIQGFAEYLEAFGAGDYAGDYEPKLDEVNKLFYNLELTNEFINYQIANLRIETQDITQRLGAYLDFQRCQIADTVLYIDEVGKKSVFWCNPTVSCQDTSVCAFDGVGKGNGIREVFDLHEESVMKPGTGDFRVAAVAIKPDANLNLDALYSLGMARIDLFVDGVVYEEKKQDFKLLQWPYKGRLNTGLSDSIRLAMRDLKDAGKLNRRLYSWYLTFPSESVVM